MFFDEEMQSLDRFPEGTGQTHSEQLEQMPNITLDAGIATAHIDPSATCWQPGTQSPGLQVPCALLDLSLGASCFSCLLLNQWHSNSPAYKAILEASRPAEDAKPSLKHGHNTMEQSQRWPQHQQCRSGAWTCSPPSSCPLLLLTVGRCKKQQLFQLLGNQETARLHQAEPHSWEMGQNREPGWK